MKTITTILLGIGILITTQTLFAHEISSNKFVDCEENDKIEHGYVLNSKNEVVVFNFKEAMLSTKMSVFTDCDIVLLNLDLVTGKIFIDSLFENCRFNVSRLDIDRISKNCYFEKGKFNEQIDITKYNNEWLLIYKKLKE
jgi:hypothetical protein